MKKAKIILASLAVFAVVGGAFAFRASRFQAPSVYSLLAGSRVTTTIVGSQTYTTTIPNCTLLNLATTNVGTPTNIYSTTSTSPAVTTVFTRAGGQQFVTTYPFCTPTNVITTSVDI